MLLVVFDRLHFAGEGLWDLVMCIDGR